MTSDKQSPKMKPVPQLLDSDERFRFMVESVVDYAIFLLDPSGYILSWNAGAARIKGYQAEEIVGQHFSVFYPEAAQKSGWPQRELEIAAAQGRFEDEGWRVRKGGSLFWANVIITALKDKNGTLEGYAKVTRDMTERRRLEEQTRQLNDELKRKVTELGAANAKLAQKSAEIEDFIYSVSHDLRTPLVNLQGFSHELSLSVDQLKQLFNEQPVSESLQSAVSEILDTQIGESIHFIQNAVLHFGKIIDGILRLSRAGRLEYQFQQVDVAATVRRIVESFSNTTSEAGAAIRVGELPPAWGDPSAIEQIWSNLISNALRYLQPGRAGEIEIGAVKPEDPEDEYRFCTYYIKDNGRGISAESQEKLFRVFHRHHPEVKGGEGIGLAMVRRMVERLNGSIRVESEQHEGTIFYLSLPCKQN